MLWVVVRQVPHFRIMVLSDQVRLEHGRLLPRQALYEYGLLSVRSTRRGGLVESLGGHMIMDTVVEELRIGVGLPNVDGCALLAQDV
jgi:hypothetical protein